MIHTSARSQPPRGRLASRAFTSPLMALSLATMLASLTGCGAFAAQSPDGSDSRSSPSPSIDLKAEGFDHDVNNGAWTRVRQSSDCDEEGCIEVTVVSERCAAPVLKVLGRASADGPVQWDEEKVLGPLFPGDRESALIGYSHPSTGWVEAVITRCDGG